MSSKTTKAKKILNLILSKQTRTLLRRRSLKTFFEYLNYVYHLGTVFSTLRPQVLLVNLFWPAGIIGEGEEGLISKAIKYWFLLWVLLVKGSN